LEDKFMLRAKYNITMLCTDAGIAGMQQCSSGYCLNATDKRCLGLDAAAMRIGTFQGINNYCVVS
jgi:hypothetical protein